jgi:hypothetical protein
VVVGQFVSVLVRMKGEAGEEGVWFNRSILLELQKKK